MDVGKLNEEYIRLLNCGEKEQVYQKFMEENTLLIPHEFVQNHGIQCSLVIRKLPFGADYKSDFFYFSKSSDDWNAIFVEIEKPQLLFFRDSTNEFHKDFNHALQQINQWRAWFNREGNKKAFLESVSTIQVPRHMRSNPTFMKFVLVYGRRHEYSNNEIRRSLIASLEKDDFKIITFDSLSENLHRKYELAIGARRNEYIDILTDDVIDPSIYCWIEPTCLRVSRKLHDKMINGGPYRHYELSEEGAFVDSVKLAARQVRIRK